MTADPRPRDPNAASPEDPKTSRRRRAREALACAARPGIRRHSHLYTGYNVPHTTTRWSPSHRPRRDRDTAIRACANALNEIVVEGIKPIRRCTRRSSSTRPFRAAARTSTTSSGARAQVRSAQATDPQPSPELGRPDTPRRGGKSCGSVAIWRRLSSFSAEPENFARRTLALGGARHRRQCRLTSRSSAVAPDDSTLKARQRSLRLHVSTRLAPWSS